MRAMNRWMLAACMPLACALLLAGLVLKQTHSFHDVSASEARQVSGGQYGTCLVVVSNGGQCNIVGCLGIKIWEGCSGRTTYISLNQSGNNTITSPFTCYTTCSYVCCYYNDIAPCSYGG